MPDPIINNQGRSLEPVHSDAIEDSKERWTARFVFFLRVMAVLSLLKGLYHWAMVCGIGTEAPFDFQPLPWQTATIFFAVIDLVAAVGLWLTAAWGAVVWLIAVISMAAVELLFPQVYGGSTEIVAAEIVLLAVYLFMAVQAARERSS